MLRKSRWEDEFIIEAPENKSTEADLNKKKLTFLLIPDSAGSPRQVSVSITLIYSLLGALLLLIIATFFLSSHFFSYEVAQEELVRLRAENQQLSDKFEQMRWNLAEVEDRYNELVSREVRIRSLFDLPEIPEEERQLGVGGPEPAILSEFSQTEKDAFITELEVDRLLRLSQFELENYQTVENSLVDIKERLRHTPSIWPTTGWVSRGYGMKYDPFTGYRQMHRGMDIANRTNTPVIATADGRVALTSSATELGKCIMLDHGFGYRTRFGHLSQILVKNGQRVKRGDVIGLMGSTGYSTGPHLHYEIFHNGQFKNPQDFILNDIKEFAANKQ
jgi:murein DD-endopeptidase MepM/ murein hydrolase activator NlpD